MELPHPRPPAALERISELARGLSHTMESTTYTGELLRSLATTKPGGRFLELGTSCGHGTAWILDGMDSEAELISVENSELHLDVARKCLGSDSRLSLCEGDARGVIREFFAQRRFDFIFADTWEGKVNSLEEILTMLRPGGIYVVDDMFPQESWKSLDYDHFKAIKTLMQKLESRPDLNVSKVTCGTGYVIAVKKPS